ncbi:hypothetical protein BGZ91_010917 [Linnemannia elongata]|nr:hypothetical protein BGZ91_010917 [Linnemannia elongata]
MTSLPRAITIISPGPSNATITWDYDACRFIDEVAFQIGQVSLRALVKKDLFDDNIFAWNCVFVQGPPGSIVYYRIQVVPSKEEGQRTSRRAAAEGILSHSQMRCSHSCKILFVYVF